MESTADEEEVLGISVADPDVLKATQFVLVSVGITAFFLAIELVAVIDAHGMTTFTKIEVSWWLFDFARAALVIFSGYLGVKRSSPPLLATFFLVSFVSCAETVFEAIYDVVMGDVISGMLTLQFFEACFFAVGMHYSRFLWKEAGQRSLQPEGTKARGGSSYNLLGIEMLDMKVLKATQMVFTSIAIMASILGSVVVRYAERAIRSPRFIFFWLSCLVLLVSLVWSGYYGVKTSSAGLLFCFLCISGTLFMLFTMSTLLTIATCGGGCLTNILFGVGIATVLAIAIKNAVYLKKKAQAGTRLTAPETQSRGNAVPPVQLGVFELDSADAAEEPIEVTADDKDGSEDA